MIKWPILPEWIEDWTQKLPWHSKDDPRFAQEAARLKKKGLPYVMPTANRQWRARKASSIKGVCVHQLWGSPHDTPAPTNDYHIGPNHISIHGAPHICYTIYVTPHGNVCLCNPLHAITWSQGDGSQPGSENRMLVSVGLTGKFRCRSHPRLPAPTPSQLEAVERVWEWLAMSFGLTEADLFGHFDFGKANCPGTDLEDWIIKTRTDSGLLVLADADDWQQALVDQGYRLGKSGPKANGVDGDWGGKSRKALVDFQHDHQLQRTGTFDRPTAWMLRQLATGPVDFIDFEDESLVIEA